jgi:hypothetical protein
LERYRQMMEEEERAEREADARGAKETMPEEEEEINEELEKQKKKGIYTNIFLFIPSL